MPGKNFRDILYFTMSHNSKLNFAQDFDFEHKKGLSQLTFLSIVIYFLAGAKYGKNGETLPFESKIRSHLHYVQYVAYGKEVV